MKKILCILGTITLIGTSTTSLFACNTPQKYTKEELEHLKKENQINTDNQEIKNNLEWIASQEKPFKINDSKYYFVIWKPNNSIYWKISKFKNDTNLGKKIEDWDPTKPYYIILNLYVFENKEQDLLIIDFSESITKRIFWKENTGQNFKSVYRWNAEEQNLPNLIIDNDGIVKVNE